MTHRLVVTQNISLDGRIEFLDAWFDPSPEDQDVADLQEEMDRQGDACAAMLLGRQTFEDFRSYWPQHEDEPAGASLARLQKYVVSRTLGDPGWQNSTVLQGDPLEEVAAAQGLRRRRPGRHREHHADPRPVRRRPGRRAAAVRLPGRPGPRPRPHRRRFDALRPDSAGVARLPRRGHAPPLLGRLRPGPPTGSSVTTASMSTRVLIEPVLPGGGFETVAERS